MRSPSPRVCGGALLAVALLAACGGSSTSEGGSAGGPAVTTWVDSVCGAIQSWVGTVSKQPTSLQSPGATIGPAQARADLSAYLQSAADATSGMFRRITDAGAPATEHGSEIGGDLIRALQPIQQAFVDAKSKIDALPVTNAKTFQTQAQIIVNSLTSATDSGKRSFDDLQQKYKGSEVERVFNSEPACNALKGG